MKFKMFILLCLILTVPACLNIVVLSPLKIKVRSSPVLWVNEDQIMDADGNPVRLRGVVFRNQAQLDRLYPRLHHDEQDYIRLKELGFNSVRFYLHYNTLENDDLPGVYQEQGWNWIDDNIAWARKHGIYLVLSMYSPPRGQEFSDEELDLWRSVSAQERFAAMWRSIAARYKDEETVAGYELLSDPIVPESIDQWRDLAEKCAAEIRKVDPHHILFVQRVRAIKDNWRENDDRNFFLIGDKNAVYGFDFSKPFHFTHQSMPWIDYVASDMRYPDPDRVMIEWFLTAWKTATFRNPKLPPGNTGWKYYEGVPFTVTDQELASGQPVLACARNSGKAYFDDLVIEELNSDGATKKIVRQIPLLTRRGWNYWAEDNRGIGGQNGAGRNDSVALTIEGTTSEANLSAEIYRFRPEMNTTYRISGWMKGEKIPDEAVCQIRIDFQTARAPVNNFDKAFLAQELAEYVKWGKKHNVPLYLSEFGTISYSFENDLGGERWAEDMLDLSEQNNLNYAYRSYHEDYFGIYSGYDSLPDPESANTKMLELLKKKNMNLKK